MNADRLLEHFHRISDAPDAVPRLRRFILDLAVRGKLVPQNSNDEPASELLKRVAAEKTQLAEAGDIKKEQPLPPVRDDEPTFRVPQSWRWTRLGIVALYIQRGKSPKYAAADGSPVISQRCVQWRGLDLTLAKQVTRESLSDYEESRFLRDGDLLWNSTGTGTIGRVIRLVDPPMSLVCDSHVTVVRCASVDAEYIRAWLRSDHVYGLVEHRASGSTNQVELTAQMALNWIVPLPPLAEQRRIVAKVDELMTLCDRLDAARAGREATRNRLAAASLARLNAPDTDSAVFADHARFALNNVAALTARSDQIKDLRQTILNLAVRGTLVPQDPNDEPASALLSEIAENRSRLRSEKKISKPKALPPMGVTDVPFTLPARWSWSRLGELCYQVSDGPHFSPQYVGPEHGVPFLSTRNVRPGSFDLSSVKYVSRADHEEFCKRVRPEKGDILYTKGGTTGIAKVNDLDFEFSVWVHLAVLRIEKERLDRRYIELALNSPHCYEQSQHYTQGISNFDLGLTRMIKITVPIPPLTEQHRIVAKVDELMALCDQLEASLAAGDDTRRRLLDALLAEAITLNVSAVSA
jgi:type I restriction enzyme, S subunit